MSYPVLTITIESGDYVDVDKLLRIKREDCFPNILSDYALAIIRAREKLGLSMRKQHLLVDYNPALDDPSIGYGPTFPVDAFDK